MMPCMPPYSSTIFMICARLCNTASNAADSETLSGIASRYGVSVAALRQVNALRRDIIKVGQVLRIPTGS